MYEILNEYDNYREVEYHRTSSYQEVDDLVSYLVNGISSRKKAKYLINMKVLLLELYYTYLEDTEQYLGVHINRNYYTDCEEVKTDNPDISAQCFIESIKYLHNKCYISLKTGGIFKFQDNDDYVIPKLTKIRMTGVLISAARDFKWQPYMVTTTKGEKLLKLKSVTEKIPRPGRRPIKFNYELDVPENDLTRGIKDGVRSYNEFLRKFSIDCAIESLTDEDKDVLEKRLIKQRKKWLLRKKLNSATMEEFRPKITLKLRRKNTCRVFNDADTTFTKGGRYFSAWWIDCPSVLRKYITIDNVPIVELDYSAMHIHLLYALEGVNYAEKNEDPYLLDDGIGDRKLNKKILLTALNAEGVDSTGKAVYTELNKKDELDGYNLANPIVTIKNKVELFKLKHPAIADKISNKWGLKLQYHDSQILERIIKFCVSENIPLLTVHDSVITKVQYVNMVRNIMLKTYAEYISEKTTCVISYDRYIHSSDVFITAIPRSIAYPIPDTMISNLELFKYPIFNMDMIRTLFKPETILKADLKHTISIKPIQSGVVSHCIRLTLDDSSKLTSVRC